MPFPSGRTLYTFAGISFARSMQNDEVVPWFYAEDSYTKDPVLGGSKVYVDIGAAVAPPLVFRASCLNTTDRYNLRLARGTVGTLTRTVPGGGTISASVLFFRAIPVNSGNYGSWWIDVGFEQVLL